MTEVKTSEKSKTKSKSNYIGAKATRIGGAAYRELGKKVSENQFIEADGLRKIHPIKGMNVVPNKIGQKQPQSIMVKPSDLWVDGSYQRNINAASLSLIQSIVGEFEWHKFKPPVLTRDEKQRLVVIDGQHTAIAACMHPDIDEIPAVLIETTSKKEQADSFIGLNTNRIHVHPVDLFKAELIAGNEQLIEMKRILDETGISIPESTSWIGLQSDRRNKTQAINTLKTAFTKLGPAKFAVLTEKIAACGFEPIRTEHIKAFAEIMFNSVSPRYSHDHLVKTVTALDDNDILLEASRTGNHMSIPKWRALVVVYKNYYRKSFNDLEAAA